MYVGSFLEVFWPFLCLKKIPKKLGMSPGNLGWLDRLSKLKIEKLGNKSL